MPYALDFNAAYDLETAKMLFEKLLRDGNFSGALYVEQPTAESEGIKALGELSKILKENKIKAIVVADESFLNLDDAVKCMQNGVALNFKIQKIGGLYQARFIEQTLLNLGFNPVSMVGGTFPTAIGRVYDQNAACCLKSTTLHSDGLLPSTDYFIGNKHLIKEEFKRLLRGENIIQPIVGPGLGVTVDENKIRLFIVENPEEEYRKIRMNSSGEKIKVKLREGESYKELYERKSGRNWDWNL
jgi:L-alanine-DL-glutamate epimerase-like enolase superfamily enzyme